MWLQRDLEHYLKEFDISYSRFSILLSIFEVTNKRICGRDLSKKAGVSKTTISKMIPKLINNQLIIACSSIKDKRITEYELTKLGIEKLHLIIPGYLKRMRIIGLNFTIEGMKRIEFYLFNGTQIQRNYATLFFVRIDDWKLVNKAYNMGLIDYVQAFSK